MIWYMCKYTPLELFAGFGEETCLLEKEAEEQAAADSLAHPNICGYGKAVLEAAMEPEAEEILLVNCCDVVRRIYEVMKQNRRLSFLYLLDLPHRRGKEEQNWFVRQLKKLTEAYEVYSGKTFNWKKAWEALPEPELSGEQEPCVSLMGAHGGRELLETVRESLGGGLLRDDTCSGRRRLQLPEEPPADREEFFELYGRVLLGQFPCMRMEDNGERRRQDPAVRGIIYHTMKFCDYYSFEYAALKDKTQVPLLKIETDGTRQSRGQLATRIAAFGESGLGFRKAAPGVLLPEKGYAAGIDSGSSSTDVVILNGEGKIAAWAVAPTGAGAAAGAARAYQEALDKAGIREQDIEKVVATGYGRAHTGMGAGAVTEITCHARGARYLDPGIRTVIDIGGQDSKVICLDELGNVANFVMNDKCAAGTGRFLEMMARTMELSMEEMSRLGNSWKEEITISSMCTVFAESEVVSLIAGNRAVPDIIHGLNKSVAAKTAALVRRLKGRGPYMMTGGVARNAGVVREIEKQLGEKLVVSPYAQLCGALGAALFALDK